MPKIISQKSFASLGKSVFLVSIFTFTFSLFSFPIFAQYEGVEVNSVFKVADDKAQDGDILSLNSSGLVRSTTAADSHLFGVLDNQALIVYRDIDKQGKAVTRTGTVLVKVSSANGAIKVGDYITSSRTPGTGQKASISGYVIGTALDNFTTATGKIPVALKFEFAEINSARSLSHLVDYIYAAVFNDIQTPDKLNQALRYLVGGLIALASFIIGFITFTRAIPKSIESIGRNPLAKSSIYLSLFLNIIFTIIISMIGIIAAIIILRT